MLYEDCDWTPVRNNGVFTTDVAEYIGLISARSWAEFISFTCKRKIKVGPCKLFRIDLFKEMREFYLIELEITRTRMCNKNRKTSSGNGKKKVHIIEQN